MPHAQLCDVFRVSMRVYVQLKTSSQRIFSSRSGRREWGESRVRDSTGTSAELRDYMAWHSVACEDLTLQTQVVLSLTAPGKPVLEFYLLLKLLCFHTCSHAYFLANKAGKVKRGNSDHSLDSCTYIAPNLLLHKLANCST